MLNMERTVGTITPKKVFSLRGSLLGEPWPDSGVASESARHAADTVSPHTPEGIRGVRSFDMPGVKGLPAHPVKKREISKDLWGTATLNWSLMHNSPFSPCKQSTFIRVPDAY